MESASTAAVAAYAVDLKFVVQHLESELSGSRILKGFDFWIVELNGFAAFHADHVVMMFVIEQMLIARNAVGEFDFARQSAAGHVLHHAVDGGVANAGIDILNAVINIFDAAVAFIIQECFEDQFAVGGEFELVRLQVIDEDLHFRLESLHGMG